MCFRHSLTFHHQLEGNSLSFAEMGRSKIFFLQAAESLKNLASTPPAKNTQISASEKWPEDLTKKRAENICVMVKSGYKGNGHSSSNRKS